MEEKIKEIISVFTRIPAEQIGPATPIDRSVMKSSILLHRMYARLAEEGVVIENYQGIKNFGDLLRKTGGNGMATADRPSDGQATGQANGQVTEAVFSAAVTAASPVAGAYPEGGIGIDIEEVASLPRTNDYRKDAFYKMNFAATEIAYCILQPEPYASFAGLFAAKEAIVKADGGFRGRGFHTIVIGHTPEGKPVHPAFHLSISHAGNMAVAVAVPSLRSAGDQQGAPAVAQEALPRPKSSLVLWLTLLSVALSVIALIIAFTH